MTDSCQIFQCPSCGERNDFIISAKVDASVDSNGNVENYGSIEWEPTSRCQCRSCDHVARVKVFEEAALPRYLWVVVLPYDDGSGDTGHWTALVEAVDDAGAIAEAESDFLNEMAAHLSLDDIQEPIVVKADWKAYL